MMDPTEHRCMSQNRSENGLPIFVFKHVEGLHRRKSQRSCTYTNDLKVVGRTWNFTETRIFETYPLYVLFFSDLIWSSSSRI